MTKKMRFMDLRLGILGGGQLGKMLCQAAANWNIETVVLDPLEDCPASTLCKKIIKGNFRNFDDVAVIADYADVVTIEIEHVSTDGLKYLKGRGIDTRPSAEILEKIKDKGLQKNFYKEHNLPTSEFRLCKNKDEITDLVSRGELKIPFVQKVRRDGYDGRGVFIVRHKDQLPELIDAESVVEILVDIKKELSVIAAKNSLGEVRCFPPVEMVFNYDANLVDYLISPADIDRKISERAEDLAVKTIKKFGLNGILAVEMFLDHNNNLLINEVAPRPHNSGHQTIESCHTSQYEQHLRALFDLPLGNPGIKFPSVMLNILGEPGYNGKAVYDGLEDCMKIDGVNIHIYGKKITKAFRKMGHITIIDSSIEKVLKKAEIIKKRLKVIT